MNTSDCLEFLPDDYDKENIPPNRGLVGGRKQLLAGDVAVLPDADRLKTPTAVIVNPPKSPVLTPVQRRLCGRLRGQPATPPPPSSTRQPLAPIATCASPEDACDSKYGDTRVKHSAKMRYKRPIRNDIRLERALGIIRRNRKRRRTIDPVVAPTRDADASDAWQRRCCKAEDHVQQLQREVDRLKHQLAASEEDNAHLNEQLDTAVQAGDRMLRQIGDWKSRCGKEEVAARDALLEHAWTHGARVKGAPTVLDTSGSGIGSNDSSTELMPPPPPPPSATPSPPSQRPSISSTVLHTSTNTAVDSSDTLSLASSADSNDSTGSWFQHTKHRSVHIIADLNAANQAAKNRSKKVKKVAANDTSYLGGITESPAKPGGIPFIPIAPLDAC